MELSVDEQIIVALRRITQAVDLWSRELWRQCGLTSPQLAVLREVVRGEFVTPTSIAEVLHLTQPTVTGILQRLERAGLLCRARSGEDRRSILASATPKGAELVANAPPLLRDRVQRKLTELSESRRKSLLADVQLLAAMLDAAESAVSPYLFSEEAVTPRSSRRHLTAATQNGTPRKHKAALRQSRR